MTPPACLTCAHCIVNEFAVMYSRCAVSSHVSPVTGETAPELCEVERSYVVSPQHCGLAGTKWQAKERI